MANCLIPCAHIGSPSHLGRERARPQFGPESIGITWLPHYHDMGLVATYLTALAPTSAFSWVRDVKDVISEMNRRQNTQVCEEWKAWMCLGLTRLWSLSSDAKYSSMMWRRETMHAKNKHHSCPLGLERHIGGFFPFGLHQRSTPVASADVALPWYGHRRAPLCLSAHGSTHRGGRGDKGSIGS